MNKLKDVIPVAATSVYSLYQANAGSDIMPIMHKVPHGSENVTYLVRGDNYGGSWAIISFDLGHARIEDGRTPDTVEGKDGVLAYMHQVMSTNGLDPADDSPILLWKAGNLKHFDSNGYPTAETLGALTVPVSDETA